jgi:arylsulfatase A-like enzyme
MTRRTALTVIPASAFAQQENQPQRPNIVFLISDDHSYSDLGCNGNRAIRTPNLDRLAQQGMRFTHGFVTSPQCSPNRSAILTGRSPHAITTSRLHAPMPDSQQTLLEHLKEHGYHVGAFRKVHQGAKFDRRWNFYGNDKQSFRSFFETAPKDRPFFLHVGFIDPHRPYTRGAFSPRHDPATVQVPGWLPDTPAVRRDLADYYDEIARMDAECGEILQLLEERTVAGNTLVVFTGDNGMPFPPRAKGTLYEAGIRVPLLARWPGKVKPGSVCDELISHLDLMPTWIEAAGLRPPSDIEGRSFLGALLGKPYPARDELFAERNWHDNFDLQRCVRTKTHKLIFNGLPHLPYRPSADLADSLTWPSYLEQAKLGKLAARHQAALVPQRPMLELYDLRSDPEEWQNLAEDPQETGVRQDLLERLSVWMDGTNDFLPPPFREFPPGSGKQRWTL